METFNVFQFVGVDREIKPVGSGYYKCPACGNEKFSIGKSGAYSCFSGGCTPEEIRESLSPSKKYERNMKTISPVARTISIPSVIEIAELDRPRAPSRIRQFPVTEISLKIKEDFENQITRLEKKLGVYIECSPVAYLLEFEYSILHAQYIQRWELQLKNEVYSKVKTFRYKHRVEGVKLAYGKGSHPWDAYKLHEAVELCDRKFVLAVEGEKCAEALRAKGLVTITWAGGDWKDEDLTRTIEKLQFHHAEGIIFLSDNDDPGEKKAQKLAKACERLGFPYLHIPSTKLDPSLPVKGDIADILERNPNFDVIGEIQKAIAQLRLQPTAEETELKKIELDLVNLSSESDPLKFEKSKSTLVASSFLNERSVQKLVEKVSEKIEREENRSETLADLDRILSAKSDSLDLTEILPIELAEPIAKLAKPLNRKKECYLTALLPVVNSLLKTGTTLELLPEYYFSVVPNLYSGIVAEISQRKSPILEVIVDPLNELAASAFEEFKQAKLHYREQMQLYEALDKRDRIEQFPEGMPQEPSPKVYMVGGDPTWAGLMEQFARFPEQGILMYSDELAVFFKSQDQFKGKSKGADGELYLQLFNGKIPITLRASGIRNEQQNATFGIVGSIQDEVLKKMIAGKDDNGQWARFLFCYQPPNKAKISGIHFPVLDLKPRLAAMYKMIDSLPPMKFYLSPKTREYFKTLFDKCETNQDESNVKAVKGAWGKGSGMIGKIAIAFHVINFCSKNETPPLEIPARTIRNAALVMGFYVRQIELIYSFCDELSDLSTELAKVLAIADRNGGKCSIRDVRRSFNANSAPSPEQVQLWFSELVAMNKGRITTLGRKVEFVVGENLLATLATNGNMVLPVESLDT